MVSFRISEEEYLELSRIRADWRLRSLSDLARRAMAQLVGRKAEAGEEKFGRKLNQLEEAIRQLRAEVAALFQLIELQRPGSQGRSEPEDGR